MRADIPGEFHEFIAFMAILFEFGLTVGAEHPCLFDAAFTSRAEELIFDRGEKGFLFKGTLIFIFQCARGA